MTEVEPFHVGMRVLVTQWTQRDQYAQWTKITSVTKAGVMTEATGKGLFGHDGLLRLPTGQVMAEIKRSEEEFFQPFRRAIPFRHILAALVPCDAQV